MEQAVFRNVGTENSDAGEPPKKTQQSCICSKKYNYEFLQVHEIINPLNAELNPICHLLTLLGAHPIFHISRIRVN
jgi:hypothetical protein